jgi:hypothetical protein
LLFIGGGQNRRKSRPPSASLKRPFGSTNPPAGEEHRDDGVAVGRAVVLGDDEREPAVALIDGFARYISAIYAERFDNYSGEKLQVTDEQPAATGVMVRSQIVKANGEPVKVNYMMRKSGDAWLISDIYLDGAISEMATRRSEFAAILRNEGIDGLIAALNRKANMLTGTTAKAF